MLKRFAFMMVLAGFLPVSAFAGTSCASSGECGCSCACQSCGCRQVKSGCQKNSGVRYNHYRNYEDSKYRDMPKSDKRTYTSANAGYVDNQPRANYYNKSNNVKTNKKSANTGMYIALGPSVQLLSFTNDYTSDYAGVDLVFEKDEYSFESVFGGYLALGTHIDSDVRADLELGISSKFVDSDEIAEFSLSVPYGMANIYRDFESGFYVGAGIGVAKVTEKIGGLLFDNVTAEKTSWSPKVGVAFGYSAKISDTVSFDLRYRLSGIKGGKLSHKFLWDQYDDGNYQQYSLRIDGGIMLENAISAGVRFNF